MRGNFNPFAVSVGSGLDLLQTIPGFRWLRLFISDCSPQLEQLRILVSLG